MKDLGSCSVIFDDDLKCTENVYCKGICRMHYERKRRGYNMTRRGIKSGADGRCSYMYTGRGNNARCDRVRYAKGFCEAHYRRSRRDDSDMNKIPPFNSDKLHWLSEPALS